MELRYESPPELIADYGSNGFFDLFSGGIETGRMAGSHDRRSDRADTLDTRIQGVGLLGAVRMRNQSARTA